MSRIKREEAEKKRQTLQDIIMEKMVVYAKEHPELKSSDVFFYGDRYIQELIRQKPQEKTLIISASLLLQKRISNYFLKKEITNDKR